MANSLESAIGKRLVAQKTLTDRNSLEFYLQWDDGTWTVIRTEYESNWSDVTPGNGFAWEIREEAP